MARVDGFATRLQIVSRASSRSIGRLVEWGSEAWLGAIGASTQPSPEVSGDIFGVS